MDIIAFYGPPGSGKSDRALVVAYHNKANCIIDDGILIYHSRIVAGSSAKREPSRLKAVRRALFWDPKQREDVKRAIQKIAPQRILILGTSDRMVRKICQMLSLPMPSKYIRIEDVAKPEEIAEARNARHKEGKHVIPVPTMELKPYFKGYLIDSLNFFRNRKKSSRLGNDERSVVRPVFSYYGKLSFSNHVIKALVMHAAKKFPYMEVQDISSSRSTSQLNGLLLRLDVKVGAKSPEDIKKLVQGMRDAVQKEIEYATGMSLESIKFNLTIDVSKNE